MAKCLLQPDCHYLGIPYQFCINLLLQALAESIPDTFKEIHVHSVFFEDVIKLWLTNNTNNFVVIINQIYWSLLSIESIIGQIGDIDLNCEIWYDHIFNEPKGLANLLCAYHEHMPSNKALYNWKEGLWKSLGVWGISPPWKHIHQFQHWSDSLNLWFN